MGLCENRKTNHSIIKTHICSMYGIFPNIGPQNHQFLSIHGAYGSLWQMFSDSPGHLWESIAGMDKAVPRLWCVWGFMHVIHKIQKYGSK